MNEQVKEITEVAGEEIEKQTTNFRKRHDEILNHVVEAVGKLL